MNTDKNRLDTELKDDSIKDERPKTLDYLWLLSCVLVTAAATFVRFFQLELKPLHHDEGVNGFFLTTLFREGIYKYDPANYHGPDLYYIALFFTKTFGLNTLSIRSSVAIFGVLTVILALFLKNYIGKTGSLFAALFLALSPGMVFVSRYFIHEIPFVFFSLAIVVSIVFFIEKRKAGILAIAWTALLLMICFVPSALNMAAAVGGKDESKLLIFRIVFLIVEAVLVFFVIRMLLAWDDGRAIYLMLASASAVMLFATKETAFITLGTMLIACGCVWLWRKIAATSFFTGNKALLIAVVHISAIIALVFYYGRIANGAGWFFNSFSTGEQKYVFYAIVFLLIISTLTWFMVAFGLYKDSSNDNEFPEPANLTWTNLRAALGDNTNLLLIVAAVGFIFIYVGILFFSSFFTYMEGVSKAFEAYAVWTKTGTKDHTQNSFWAYAKWGMKIEAPIMILSALGCLIALLRVRNRFAVFASFWAFGMFAAYTIIPYKTPWLALSFLLPMCIIAGYGIGELFRSNNIALKIAGGILAISATGILAYQTYDANFVRYDDEEMPYVYAHTKRGFLDLIKQIDYYAEKSGKDKDATIEVVSPDYWSMPWYLNDYPKANFHGRFVDATTAEMIVAKKDEQDAQVIQDYSAHYKYVGKYPLRPGVDLILLVRKDLAETGAKELYQIENE